MMHGGLVPRETAVAMCAAVELLHTATLLHDDVIDGGLVRRHRAALWRETGPAGAILLGDVLLTESLILVSETDGGAYVPTYLERIREICLAVVEEELGLRSGRQGREEWLRICRGKTGALFGLVAQVSAGPGSPAEEPLREAGYQVGIAYQVIDDLIDVVGDERVVGKTLGSDERRGLATLPGAGEDPAALAQSIVGDVSLEAMQALEPWPDLQEGLRTFLRDDLGTVLRSSLPPRTADGFRTA